MGNWFYGDNPNAIFLIPIRDISFNEPILGNHPSKEAVQKYLEKQGKPVYTSCVQGRIAEAKRLYIEGHHDGIEFSLDGHKVYWSGHKRDEQTFFWNDKFHNKKIKFFEDFNDLWNYVKTEGINMYPIYVYLERDGEIFLMEGRHRWICAYLQGMEKIPCIIRVRINSYEPKFKETLRRIEATRLVSAD